MQRCPDCGWPLTSKVCQHCKNEDYDNDSYLKFCAPGLIDKTLNTLEGILIGISLDNDLNEHEVNELTGWCLTHAALANKHPYNELFTCIFSALDDNVLTLEEKDDILWLIRKLHSDSLYYDFITGDMQKLQGIIHGILSDGKITKSELDGLMDWMANNEQLTTYYPYDEIYALITDVLKDGIVSQDKENLLKVFFSEFANIGTEKRPLTFEEKQCLTRQGICALAPDITVVDHVFCFTGKSTKATRSEIAETVENAGGIFHDAVTAKTDYLIVGNDGNPCWAFSCYGRKVEKAIDLRKKGNHILIVNEIDFWDELS